MVSQAKGFTLIEMTLVLCMISLLAMVVTISYSKQLPEKHLKEAAAQLYMDLHEAKSLAVLNRQSMAVIFNPQNQTYSINQVDAAGNPVIPAMKTVNLSNFKSGISYGNGPATVPYTGASFGSDYITYTTSNRSVTFNAQGMANNQGYVYLTNMNNSACYVLGTPTRAGLIKMRKTASGSWPND